MRSSTPQQRRAFARDIVAAAGVRDPRIEEAFAQTPREDYAGPPPWFVAHAGRYVATNDLADLYRDRLVAIDAARGINIGQPTLHARCFEELALKEGETIVHVGAGVGYYTAMLAQLVGATGRAIGYEIDPDIAARARANLRGFPNVVIEARSGVTQDLPAADAIYVNAGAATPYRDWLNALKAGGRLLFPFEAPGAIGAMLLIERPAKGDSWPARFLFPVAFIPCEAAHDLATESRLAGQFDDEGWRRVRSLRFDAPDETSWFDGPDWRLSTAAP